MYVFTDSNSNHKTSMLLAVDRCVCVCVIACQAECCRKPMVFLFSFVVLRQRFL